MGLDITHYKATLQKPADLNTFEKKYIIESEFDGFDVNFDYFSKFIQQIEIPQVLNTIIFPKSVNEIENIKSKYNDEKYLIFYEKDFTNFNNIIDRFIIDNYLDGVNVKSFDNDKYISFDIFKVITANGFYFEEVGYQRKGMNKNFWDKFINDKTYCYTNKEYFEFVLSCIDNNRYKDSFNDFDNTTKLFKENFIDKYELNCSWMELNY